MTITTACTSPLDEPRTITGDRSRCYFWPLARAQGTAEEGTGWAGVELSVHHGRDRKQFWTALHPVTVFDNGWAQTTVSLLTAPAWRLTQPVARYSAKAMNAFADRALAEFRRAYTDDHPGVRGLFAAPQPPTTSQ